jgi:hypothetical protein
MTPKEKAKDLVMKFYDSLDEYGFKNVRDLDASIYCALIAVDEVLGHMGADRGVEFWQEVKKEIEAI